MAERATEKMPSVHWNSNPAFIEIARPVIVNNHTEGKNLTVDCKIALEWIEVEVIVIEAPGSVLPCAEHNQCIV